MEEEGTVEGQEGSAEELRGAETETEVSSCSTEGEGGGGSEG